MESSRFLTTSQPNDNVTVTNLINREDDDEDDVEIWSVVFDYVQIVFTSAGFVANILTLVNLWKFCDGFSRLILILLRHQSFVDALVCAMATAVIVQPSNWLSGNYVFDLIICHAWHGQAFYWGAVTLSTYNLVLIACERNLAVCHPFLHAKYTYLSRKALLLAGATLYLICLAVTHGTYIQTKLVDGECISEFPFEGMEDYFFGFVIFTYLATYLLPVVFMAGLYTMVIRRLTRRQFDINLGQSKTIDRASANLTKTAVVVTVIFAVSIGYDLHYYLLGFSGATSYILNSPIQKVGVFLSNLNSVANPVVYASLMPVFRRCLLHMLLCRQANNTVRTTSQRPSGTATTDVEQNTHI